MSNQQMEEKAEQQQAETLAEKLGLTVDELELIGYELEEAGSDDGHPYYILVRFLDDSQKAILDKIEGLDGMAVRVDLNLFNYSE